MIYYHWKKGIIFYADTKKLKEERFMKKIIYFIGAFVSVAAIFAAIAIMLKKLKISLSIEGIDDSLEDEDAGSNIDLSIEAEPDAAADDEEAAFDETASVVEEALENMLGEDEDGDISVEITSEE